MVAPAAEVLTQYSKGDEDMQSLRLMQSQSLDLLHGRIQHAISMQMDRKIQS